MTWNFSTDHIDRIIEIAEEHRSHMRINPLKPVQRDHMASLPDARMFYEGFSRLMNECEQVDLGEPLLATAAAHPGKGCPAGARASASTASRPDGRVPVSPCVYLHDYKVGDLLVDDLYDIVRSPQFRSFRRRNANPHIVEGCAGCSVIETCRGGCAARSYLHQLFDRGAGRCSPRTRTASSTRSRDGRRVPARSRSARTCPRTR